MDCFGEQNVCGYKNLEDKSVEKTPFSHPYSYDEFVIYKDPELFKKGQYAAYSDRLWEYDHKHFEACTEQVWGDHGQLFDQRANNPSLVEKFLTLYNRTTTILTAIVQGCNVGNGNPYWIFYYTHPEELKTKNLKEDNK